MWLQYSTGPPVQFGVQLSTLITGSNEKKFNLIYFPKETQCNCKHRLTGTYYQNFGIQGQIQEKGLGTTGSTETYPFLQHFSSSLTQSPPLRVLVHVNPITRH